jgi:hypothetical protein
MQDGGIQPCRTEEYSPAGQENPTFKLSTPLARIVHRTENPATSLHTGQGIFTGLQHGTDTCSLKLSGKELGLGSLHMKGDHLCESI